MDTNQSGLLTPEEAARLKNVTKQCIYDAVRSGRLPHVIVLGRIGIKKEDLESFQPWPKSRDGLRRGLKVSESSRPNIIEGQRDRWHRHRMKIAGWDVLNSGSGAREIDTGHAGKTGYTSKTGYASKIGMAATEEEEPSAMEEDTRTFTSKNGLLQAKIPSDIQEDFYVIVSTQQSVPEEAKAYIEFVLPDGTKFQNVKPLVETFHGVFSARWDHDELPAIKEFSSDTFYFDIVKITSLNES